MIESLNELGAAGSASKDNNHLCGPRVTVIVRSGKQASSQQTATVDDTRNEFWVDRKALEQLLSGCFGAALQIRQVWPRCLGINVVGSKRRDTAPVVNAAFQQALVVILSQIGRCLNVHVAQQKTRNRNGAEMILCVRFGRLSHRNIRLGAKVLENDFLDVSVLLMQALNGEQCIHPLLVSFADANQDSRGERNTQLAGVGNRL